MESSIVTQPPAGPENSPAPDCALCPRLAAHRDTLRAQNPDWHNAPVNAVGDPDGWLAIVGMAPGEKSANRIGLPFADNVLLFNALIEAGLAEAYEDGAISFEDMLLTNAVRCAPPRGKVEAAELRQCRPYLEADLKNMPNLKVVVALGQAAHQSVIKALGCKLPKYPFGHGTVHRLHTGYVVVDSYHPGRNAQNTQPVTAEALLETLELAIANQAGHPARKI